MFVYCLNCTGCAKNVETNWHEMQIVLHRVTQINCVNAMNGTIFDVVNINGAFCAEFE